MSVSPDVRAFLASIGQVAKDAHRLADTVRLSTASHNALRIALQQTPGIDVGKAVNAHAGIKEVERLHAFLVALLEYVGQHDSVVALTSGKGKHVATMTPASAGDYLSAYEAWSVVYSRASMVFQAQDTPFFGPTLRFVGSSYVLLAVSADNRTGDLAQPCVTDAVSKISRTTGVAAIDRAPQPGEQTKRSEVLWLANASFRCYFKLNNVRLCETVLGSVENALTLNRSFASAAQKAAAGEDVLALGMACYGRADKVAYRYYLGRLRLSQQRIRAAYDELRWAFDNCTNAHMHNKNLILTHCVVSAMILGIYPTRALLHASGLDGPFGELIERVRCGDGVGMQRELESWREWHRARGHYLLLREKLEIGAWRNLMRRSFLITRLVSGLGPPVGTMTDRSGTSVKTPPPVLKLASFLIMARLAWQEQNLELDDVECVTASLIDQGYIKAYAMHSSGNVVFKRSPDFGFVKMSTVY